MKIVSEAQPLPLAGVSEALDDAAPQGRRPWAVPARFRQAEGDRGVTLTTSVWHVPDHGEGRTVRVSSRQIDILNFFFFPADHLDGLVLVAELVRFGPKPIVSVVDLCGFSDASGDLGRGILHQSHEIFPDLINAGDPPEWFCECRSGQEFFLRPDSTESFNRSCEMLLHLWMRVAPMAALGEASRATRAAVRSYKDHHATHSPSRPFLEKTFGSGWTETFLREVLFR